LASKTYCCSYCGSAVPLKRWWLKRGLTRSRKGEGTKAWSEKSGSVSFDKCQAARPGMVKAGLPESQSFVGVIPGRFDLSSRIVNQNIWRVGKRFSWNSLDN